MKNTTAKKFKYGSLSVVFTVVFIALVIGVNLIVSALDTSFNLRVDLTETELYSISPETDVALRAGLGDNYESFKVTIKFLDERDVIESSETALYVQQLAEEYARQYPNNISVEYIDITKNPGAVEKYLNETQTSVDRNYVIIEGAYHYRILHLAAFFITSEDTGALYAFQGESRFTAAILQSSIETPQIVAFTTQHGETTSASMMSMFDEAGFEIQTIDLAKEEIPEDVRILVISNPTNDFQGFDGANPDVRTEMVKISEYMQSYRSLIVLVNKETPALPNLQEYLWEYWGLNYKPQHLITDEKSSLPGTDYYSVIAEYVGTSESAPNAYQLHQTVSQTSGVRTVFRNATELVADTGKSGKSVEVALQTSPSAKSTYDGEETTGSFPLLALSTEMNYAEDNSAQYRYVMLVASTDFANDSFLTSGYGNRRILSSAARMMSTQRNIPDIDYKKFEDDALTLDQETARNLTIFITVFAPLIIIVIGLVVYLRRRHL